MGQWLTFREGIEQADVCFRKALIHYQYGQRRQAVGAYREGAMRLSQAQFRFPETTSAVRQKAALSARQVSAQDRLLGAALDEAIRLSKPQACAGGGAR